ncbi:MAG: adenosylcobinamide-GDP ribazoletransferase [Alphaproteobacteria bacterium]|nr:adenosylcobinamide-GDP ribazoletransferase [Alphaproteobacteria bacterium]MDA8004835.1 adenosylcobinamide-GDP ribazoletransferase [Alphaproteobacteria bacterium]MDA8005835.1 adenosylcobinamide-GDP ribazoletransferase [Alphaproteobacteria bacterium]MDA8013242.1 adenosylcobinamide-GDP ribazoletransferase [Alphaproteobacteria bacterium]
MNDEDSRDAKTAPRRGRSEPAGKTGQAVRDGRPEQSAQSGRTGQAGQAKQDDGQSSQSNQTARTKQTDQGGSQSSQSKQAGQTKQGGRIKQSSQSGQAEQGERVERDGRGEGVSRPLASLGDDCLRALGLLSRIPVAEKHLSADSELNARATRAFPVAGLVIALALWVLWCVFFLLFGAGLLTAALVVAASLLLTGALHEDGLADTADALGVASARRGEVARDPHVGAYGVCAVVMSLLLRVGALATAASPTEALVLLGLSEVFSRTVLVYALWRGAAPSDSRLARVWAGASEEAMAFATVTALVMSVVIVFVGLAPLSGWILALALAAAGCLLLTRRLGARDGETGRPVFSGDVFGAIQQGVLVLTLLGAVAGGV